MGINQGQIIEHQRLSENLESTSNHGHWCVFRSQSSHFPWGTGFIHVQGLLDKTFSVCQALTKTFFRRCIGLCLTFNSSDTCKYEKLVRELLHRRSLTSFLSHSSRRCLTAEKISFFIT